MISASEATFAARLLLSYRTQLADLLTRAEAAGRNAESEINHAVGTLLWQLSIDLIELYQEAARGALTHSDTVTVVPALERMRDVLRSARRHPRPLRDILHKAIATIAANSP
jgi:hypothetical protein